MKKSILATLVIMTAGFASSAMAVLPPATVNGGTVNFAGNLVPAACEISTSSKNMAIDLGVIDLASIPKVMNTTSHPVPFAIDLENCDSAISTNVNVAFSAENAVNGKGAVNKASTTPAKAHLLLAQGTYDGNINGTTIVPLTGTYNSTHVKTITDGAMRLAYSAQYLHPDTTPTAGNTMYPVTFKVKYN